MSQQTAKPYWTVGNILGLVLGVIILGGIAAFAIGYYDSASKTGAIPILQVTVSGSASTVGFSTSPVRVDFCSGTYQPNFQTPISCNSSGYNGKDVSAGVNNGQYQLVLDNHSTWYVFLTYNTALQIQSICYAGSVIINSISGTYTYDVRC